VIWKLQRCRSMETSSTDAVSATLITEVEIEHAR
jgi:hypothetical protein